MRSLITAIVIDDDIDTADVLCEFLELKGINVIGKGYNGKEAVDLYATLKPDVVFLDVMMPYYDGFYALEEIKNVDPKANVIMVTADLSYSTESRLKTLNASAIIYKPYDRNLIMKKVNELFEKT